MRVLIFSILFPFISCCIGNRKCQQDDNSARFRILDKITGNDLVFGPSRIYDKNFISFYSLNGTDTIFHSFSAGPNPQPGQDSLLFVQFDNRKKLTVFVRLNNADTDTLGLSYVSVDEAPCCPDFLEVVPLSYNNRSLDQSPGGITIIKK